MNSSMKIVGSEKGLISDDPIRRERQQEMQRRNERVQEGITLCTTQVALQKHVKDDLTRDGNSATILHRRDSSGMVEYGKQSRIERRRSNHQNQYHPYKPSLPSGTTTRKEESEAVISCKEKGQLRKSNKKGNPSTKPVQYLEGEREMDAHRLAQRQKQIDFGKNTIGYDRYTVKIPRHKRKPGDPRTPDKNLCLSKRHWDAKVRKWRQALHAFDEKDDSNDVSQITALHTVAVEEKAAAAVNEGTQASTSEADSVTVPPSSADIFSVFDDFDEDEEEDDLL